MSQPPSPPALPSSPAQAPLYPRNSDLIAQAEALLAEEDKPGFVALVANSVQKALPKALGLGVKVLAKSQGADDNYADLLSSSAEAIAEVAYAQGREALAAANATTRLRKEYTAQQAEADRQLQRKAMQDWIAERLQQSVTVLHASLTHQTAQLATIEAQVTEIRRQLHAQTIPGPDPLVRLLNLRTLSLPKSLRRRSPAMLLDPRYEVVPFDEASRAAELQALRDFCNDDTLDQVELRLFVGPGGAGKTRLLIHFCNELWGRTDQHWHAGFLHREGLDPAHLNDILQASHPSLLVIDYAESQSLSAWLKELVERAEDSPRAKLRIVLLARQAGDWWQNLSQGDAAVEDLCRSAPIAMQALSLPEHERTDHFSRALNAFASSRELTAPQPPVPSLTDEHYGRPLFVHMAALEALLGEADAIHEAQDLPWRMVRRESNYWLVHDPQAAGDTLNWPALRLIAAITLRGGVSLEDLDSLTKVVGYALPTPAEQRLIALYRRQEGLKGIGPLQPDLLGEALVLQVLTRDDTRGSFIDVLNDASHDELQQALTVLGRIAVQHPTDIRPWVEPILAVDIQGRAAPAIRATLAVGERHVDDVIGRTLADTLGRSADGSLAEALRPLLPEHSVGLREVSLWVWQKLKMESDTDKKLAWSAGGLGIALSNLGRREEALAATEEAVAIRRTLAQARPDAFLPDLASALNNLGIWFSNLGRREEALAATEEALATYRTLAQARPDAFLPDLANSLWNHSLRLEELDRIPEARTAAEEAHKLFSPLAERWPDVFAADLQAVEEILARLNAD